MPAWPTEADWAALNRATNGRLSRVSAPALSGAEAKKLLANPFFIGDQQCAGLAPPLDAQDERNHRP
jgi:hypothetical protein